jgi:methylthioxylose transferase
VNFSTHIKGHPPGYMLMLKALSALGLAKPWIIASLSYFSAGVVAGSVLVVARRFGTAKFTRKAAPMLILGPYAVWMGTSADAVFSALVALAAAGIALATTSRQNARRITFSLFAGLSIGAALYSSWGTVTCGPILFGVLWCGTVRNALRGSWQGVQPGLKQSTGHHSKPELTQPRERTLVSVSEQRTSLGSMLRTSLSTAMDRIAGAIPVAVWVLTGVSTIAVTLTALGYNWFAGMGLTKRFYWKGTAQFRPWTYFLVGNLGAVFIAIGVVAVLGIGVAISGSATTHRDNRWLRMVMICALISVVAANLSQYSKGEVERIWLPVMPWLTVPAALLNRPRFWLVLQAATAVGLQVMLISKW